MALLTVVAPDAQPPEPNPPTLAHRQRVARLFREFLRSYPRAEEDATLTFPGFDGREHTVTRKQCSEAMDRMRPRMRRIMRVHIEQGQPREILQRETGYSFKTMDRDQKEALDILAAL